MELIAVMRVLRRRWRAVAIGAMLAFAVLITGVYSVSISPPGLQRKVTTTGVATSQVLVNTPSSLVVDARARGVKSIVARASFLGSLAASDAARAQIAHRLGLAPREVEISGPGSGVPVVPTALAEQATEVAKPHTVYVVNIDEDPSLPILTISTAGPDPAAAGRLANATTAEMTALTRSSPALHGTLAVDPIGTATHGTKSAGGSRVKAVLAAAILFVVWCVGVALLDAFGRRRHEFADPSWRGAGA
jgi:hypothetical protein